jgi:hypothetical protein
MPAVVYRPAQLKQVRFEVLLWSSWRGIKIKEVFFAWEAHRFNNSKAVSPGILGLYAATPNQRRRVLATHAADGAIAHMEWPNCSALDVCFRKYCLTTTLFITNDYN